MLVGVGGGRGRRKERQKLQRIKGDRARDRVSYIMEGGDFRHPRSSI